VPKQTVLRQFIDPLLLTSTKNRRPEFGAPKKIGALNALSLSLPLREFSFTRAFNTLAPSWDPETLDKEPIKLPMGVRFAA